MTLTILGDEIPCNNHWLMYYLLAMKQKIMITIAACVAYCINKELYRAIDSSHSSSRSAHWRAAKTEQADLFERQTKDTYCPRPSFSTTTCSKNARYYSPQIQYSAGIENWLLKIWGSQNRKKTGRPTISTLVVKLVLKFKKENPRWRYQKIADQINYLGFQISETSVKNILVRNGLDPILSGTQIGFEPMTYGLEIPLSPHKALFYNGLQACFLA